MRRVAALGLAIAVVVAGAAGADQKEQPKGGQAQVVDSGSFGVFIRGQRMLTETFSIQQASSGSIVKAQLREAAGGTPTDQKSSMEITPNAELTRYEWNGGPGGGSLQVLPKNDFLIEKITTPGSSKPAEQSFLMPSTSMILDNNFFVYREVLIWRYMAADCHQESSGLKCKSPEEFGALVPQDRTSLRVRIELVGKEKVTIRGIERQLLRLNLSGEGFEWAIWIDDQNQFKLMRVSIPADNTEVVRD